MTAPQSFVIEDGAAPMRLDVLVAGRFPALSRARAHDLIASGHIRVGGQLVRPSYRPRPREVVAVDFPPLVSLDLRPESMDFSIVYEDGDLLVLDKPPGVAVHPAPGHQESTIVHGLLARYPNLPGINGVHRPGIVHRLDLDTSGLLIVAKTETAARSLVDQFQRRTVHKGYLAVVLGAVSDASWTIDAPIARDRLHRKRMEVAANGRPATTRFARLFALPDRSALLAMPKTGRTHQIRVHLARVGHPVAGDALYGGGDSLMPRQFLHAAFLSFDRPSDGQRVQLSTPLPPDLHQALATLQAGSRPLDSEDLALRMLRLASDKFLNR